MDELDLTKLAIWFVRGHICGLLTALAIALLRDWRNPRRPP